MVLCELCHCRAGGLPCREQRRQASSLSISKTAGAHRHDRKSDDVIRETIWHTCYMLAVAELLVVMCIGLPGVLPRCDPVATQTLNLAQHRNMRFRWH